MMDVKSFCKKMGFTAFNKTVNTNVNGYPFITFLSNVDGKNIAQNVYFSKRASELVDEGSAVDRSLFEQLQAREIVYTDGRAPQWKLCSLNGDSAYASVDDL
jgi:hypothetical protein